jgi:hypothetical protein
MGALVLTPMPATGSGQEEVHLSSDSARLCETCFVVRPLTDFRRRARDSEVRVRQCRRCHNEFERYRRAATRARISKRRMAQDLAKVRDAVSERRVKVLCAAMVAGYGGTEGFVNAWLRCLDRDLAKGGFDAFRHLEYVLRLMQHCERDRRDYSRMTDEELEQARIAILEQLHC